ncbi:MAG: hypothetical protein JW820_11285, partial [Spirochaetales bacterium]|nr:hypothetical protein [Spirochaetales bacterium]
MRRNQKGTQPRRLIGWLAPRPFHRPALRCFGTALALLLLAAATGYTQDAWEGNAAVVRRGTFAEPGLFAASNSFPTNSLVEVRNPATDAVVRVTVIQRIEGTENIFILLSEEAAQRLGVSEAEVLPVSARVVASPTPGGPMPGEEPALSPDPDVNPAAAIEALEPEAAAPEEVTEVSAAPVEQPPVAQAQPAEEPEP